MITGWWVIYLDETGAEEHRIPTDKPKGSPSWERADDALYYKVDFERFSVEWVDA